ncbi:flagellar hook-associated protein FlgK [Geothermobacter hydrogeniphilus]|uniref:Flagellar hook-associated protein 1 n=1 Tax=Geothermobacter hydrogeniphilus TaxID=1969733 RepID=A0A2K2HCX3_9BACT|nr:flagellar hook-associated protein FlgK [Geothermobacter hydrogeniphilus]PNU21148.1 flagellar hook-associated protein FlgK [Geothermobacter hydrogeniphilus]
MGGLLAALNASKTSITTQQKAMEVVGNNIANVNTPGYSRQTPTLTPFPTLSMGDFFIGQGVRVSSIERASDAFLTKQIQTKTADLGMESSKASPLASVERTLPVDDTGVAAEIDRFFDAWQELSTNPDGRVERDLVMQHGGLVADAFLNTYNDLQSVSTNIDNALVSKIDGVNLKLSQVAELNNRIATVELSGNNANSDRDRRDLLVKELANSLGVQALEDSRHMVMLQLPGGLPLVEGTEALQIEGVPTGSTLKLQLKLGSTIIDLPREGMGGEFRGLLDIRDQLVPDLQGRLDQLAYDFATAINTQHRTGSGLDGISGRDFFNQPAAVAGAATSLSMAFSNNDFVAAGATMAPGDNTNALQIAGLKATPMVNGQDSYTAWYGKMAATVGMEASQNELSLSGLEDTLTQLNNVRDSTVGVSLEEEMISLIQYQKGFEASAKFLGTVDEMMDSILMIKR